MSTLKGSLLLCGSRAFHAAIVELDLRQPALKIQPISEAPAARALFALFSALQLVAAKTSGEKILLTVRDGNSRLLLLEGRPSTSHLGWNCNLSPLSTPIDFHFVFIRPRLLFLCDFIVFQHSSASRLPCLIHRVRLTLPKQSALPRIGEAPDKTVAAPELQVTEFYLPASSGMPCTVQGVQIPLYPSISSSFELKRQASMRSTDTAWNSLELKDLRMADDCEMPCAGSSVVCVQKHGFDADIGCRSFTLALTKTRNSTAQQSAATFMDSAKITLAAGKRVSEGSLLCSLDAMQHSWHLLQELMGSLVPISSVQGLGWDFTAASGLEVRHSTKADSLRPCLQIAAIVAYDDKTGAFVEALPLNATREWMTLADEAFMSAASAPRAAPDRGRAATSMQRLLYLLATALKSGVDKSLRGLRPESIDLADDVADPSDSVSVASPLLAGAGGRADSFVTASTVMMHEGDDVSTTTLAESDGSSLLIQLKHELLRSAASVDQAPPPLPPRHTSVPLSVPLDDEVKPLAAGDVAVAETLRPVSAELCSGGTPGSDGRSTSSAAAVTRHSVEGGKIKPVRMSSIDLKLPPRKGSGFAPEGSFSEFSSAGGIFVAMDLSGDVGVDALARAAPRKSRSFSAGADMRPTAKLASRAAKPVDESFVPAVLETKAKSRVIELGPRESLVGIEASTLVRAAIGTSVTDKMLTSRVEPAPGNRRFSFAAMRAPVVSLRSPIASLLGRTVNETSNVLDARIRATSVLRMAGATPEEDSDGDLDAAIDAALAAHEEEESLPRPIIPKSLQPEYAEILRDGSEVEAMAYIYLHHVGTVTKRGHFWANWRRRWFVLNANRVTYFLDTFSENYDLAAPHPSSTLAVPCPPPTTLPPLSQEILDMTASDDSDRRMTLPVAWPLPLPCEPAQLKPSTAEEKGSLKHQGRKRGEFVLSALSRAFCVNLVGRRHCFCVTTANADKPYLCQAPNEGARREWVRVFQHNIRVLQRWERRKALWKAASSAAEALATRGPHPSTVDVPAHLFQMNFGNAPGPPRL
jgi:hypothetical protein